MQLVSTRRDGYPNRRGQLGSPSLAPYRSIVKQELPFSLMQYRHDIKRFPNLDGILFQK